MLPRKAAMDKKVLIAKKINGPCISSAHPATHCSCFQVSIRFRASSERFTAATMPYIFNLLGSVSLRGSLQAFGINLHINSSSGISLRKVIKILEGFGYISFIKTLCEKYRRLKSEI